jgi:hypothetical protein
MGKLRCPAYQYIQKHHQKLNDVATVKYHSSSNIFLNQQQPAVETFSNLEIISY